MLPWWGWLIVAWLAADLVFVLAWTMRGRIREREALEARFPEEASEGPGELHELTPPAMPVERRSP